MISGMAAMGPDYGQLRPIVFDGGPRDATTMLHPCPPEEDLPEAIEVGRRSGDGAIYRRCGTSSQGTLYRWESTRHRYPAT